MRAVLAIATLLLASQPGFADAEGEIKYRQGVMDAVGGHMSAMAAILRNQVYFDNFQLHANAMADLAEVVPHVFPEGSGDGKTEALPEIWEEPEDFQVRVDDFVKAARNMAAAAETGEMGEIAPAIDTLGKSCKGCHDNFREEHDH